VVFVVALAALAITSGLETRLQTISQEILSRARIENLITRFALHAGLRRQDGFVVVAAHGPRRAVLAEALGLMDPAKVVGLAFDGAGARRSSYDGYDDVYAGSSSKAPRRWPWRKS